MFAKGIMSCWCSVCTTCMQLAYIIWLRQGAATPCSPPHRLKALNSSTMSCIPVSQHRRHQDSMQSHNSLPSATSLAIGSEVCSAITSQTLTATSINHTHQYTEVKQALLCHACGRVSNQNDSSAKHITINCQRCVRVIICLLATKSYSNCCFVSFAGWIARVEQPFPVGLVLAWPFSLNTGQSKDALFST